MLSPWRPPTRTKTSPTHFRVDREDVAPLARVLSNRKGNYDLSLALGADFGGFAIACRNAACSGWRLAVAERPDALLGIGRMSGSPHHLWL